MKKRIMACDVTFGGETTDGTWVTFKLTEGDVFEASKEKDKFGRHRTIIQGKEMDCFTVTLDRMSDWVV